MTNLTITKKTWPFLQILFRIEAVKTYLVSKHGRRKVLKVIKPKIGAGGQKNVEKISQKFLVGKSVFLSTENSPKNGE